MQNSQKKDLEMASKIGQTERNKLISSVSAQKLVEFLKNGGKLFIDRNGEQMELTVNSNGELCYVVENGVSRSIKLMRNFDNEELNEESKDGLVEYLNGQAEAAPQVSSAISMVRLAAGIGINVQMQKFRKTPRVHTIVVGYTYDKIKEHEENARKIYVEIANHIFNKECSYYLANETEEVRVEMEVPADTVLAREIRKQIELNPELTMKFERSNTPEKCLLIVKRGKKR